MILRRFFRPELLRGLEKADWVSENVLGRKYPHSNAFMPNTKTAAERNDKAFEISINHFDSVRAIVELRKDGNNAANGIAVLPKRAIAETSKKIVGERCLSLERKRLPTNPFHGNILLKNQPDEKQRRHIAACLATSCTEVIPPLSLRRSPDAP
jgi:hypothetical protein